MQLSCPRCRTTGPIEAFTEDVDARRVVGLAAALPAQIGPLAVRYLALFAPPKRALSWARARKVLEELSAAIAISSIKRRGRDWPVTTEMWNQALQQMLDSRDSLRLPLKGQGYLFEILAHLADKSEGEAERRGELLTQQQSQARHAPIVDEAAAAEAERVRAARVRSAIDSENKTRARFNQPPLTKDEELLVLQRLELA
jgi:hypothetical protein